MPSQNPFLDEIDDLVTAIIDLKIEKAMSSGAAADAIGAEIAAKTEVIDNLQAQSEDWRLQRLDAAVSKLQKLAETELAKQARVTARLRMLLQRVGGTPAPQPAAAASPTPATTPSPDTAPAPTPQPVPPTAEPFATSTGDHIQIVVQPEDFDALCRVSQSEVGHFAKHGADQLKGGVEAVVETVINRVAHKGFRATIQGVIDQPFQFSAINSLGSWTKLPMASASVTGIVQNYLERRAGGAAGFLRGATHFLNPHLSSQTALNQWGNHVVANAIAEFGDNSKKDVHFHGFAPGAGLPRDYQLMFGTASPVFDGRGRPRTVAGTSNLRSRLIASLQSELAFFDNGKLKETDDPQFLRVGDYWQSIGKSLDGRTIVTLADGSQIRPAWSAAFISWALISQGVDTTQFRGAQAHWVYFNDLLDNVLPNPLFEVMDPTIYAPQPGDMVHYGRTSAAHFDLAATKTFLDADKFYPSHSDFVVDIDSAAGTATTIGGNVDNAVKSKRVKIDANGLLQPRVSNGKTFPWIAVLRLKTA